MAWFSCNSGGGSGSGATITVTYDSSFYNKTITCSNGDKIYTKTTSNSGSTTFDIKDEGTWTITCNGVSRTVEVVLSYSTEMAVTKTITVYGAVGATISFTDTTGSKTVTLDSNGEGSVSITYIPEDTITFTDTNVAKDFNNLSNVYTKNVELDSNTTEVYVMPDNALYWWGFLKNCEACIGDNGWSARSAAPLYPPTFNTNSVYLPAAVKQTRGIANATIIDLTDFTNVKCVCTNGGSTADGVSIGATKYLYYPFEQGSLASAVAREGVSDGNYMKITLPITNINQDAYVCGVCSYGTAISVYALYLE